MKGQLAGTQFTSGPYAVHIWARDPQTWGSRIFFSSPSGGMASNQIAAANPVDMSVNEMSSNAKVLISNMELKSPTCEDHCVVFRVSGFSSTGVPRSRETAISPKATIGPYAESYCRVLGWSLFRNVHALGLVTSTAGIHTPPRKIW